MYYINNIVILLFLLLICSCDKRTPGTNIDSSITEKLKPIASFTNSLDSIGIGQTINFVNTSKNYPTQYSWICKGGNPSYSNNPSVKVKYDTIGLFDVSLLVKNSFGSDSILKTKLIKVAFSSDFSSDFTYWSIEKNWFFSTSNNIIGNKGMLAYSAALNGNTQTNDNATMSRTFSYIPTNSSLQFWYYIYSTKGILNVKENGKIIGSISGYGKGTSVLTLNGGLNSTITFEAILYQTSSIYISNIIINPK
jgi:PKD repeat protein